VTTPVTTRLVRRIADCYDVQTYDKLLVGFKWIAEQIDISGAENFLYGTEESHGYKVGKYSRDKDRAVASMLIVELATETKSHGLSLHEKLDALFEQHGCHAEKTISVYMHGETGMQQIKSIMTKFREAPPEVLADMQVRQVRDDLEQTVRAAQGAVAPLDGPSGNLVMLDFQADGNYVAVRPSGTEPKIKFYLFTCHPPEDGSDRDAVQTMLQNRLTALAHDLNAFAGA